MEEFGKLLTIVKRKSIFDQSTSWVNGSETYLTVIKREVDEVIEEIPKLRLCYFEEELGDVLWDYLNVITALEKEVRIELKSVLSRACQKYNERVSGIEAGELWTDIKAR